MSSGRFPVVRPVGGQHGSFAIYAEDGRTVARTTEATVTCVVPGPAGEPGWFRRPPHPPASEQHEFVSMTEAAWVPGPELLAHGLGFERTRFMLPAFGKVDGWDYEHHLRTVADLTGDGRADLVGFGWDGVWTALGDGSGGFAPARLVLEAFAPGAGGWLPRDHPRHLADLTGDGRADIVGFAEDGVWTALGDGAGGFSSPTLVLPDFGLAAGGWHWYHHPRLVGDLTGNGVADIVGFADAGVQVALGDGAGGFTSLGTTVEGLGRLDHWRSDEHTRTLADVTGDGCLDIVAIGDDGVWVALGDGHGGFAPPRFVLASFGTKSGWDADRWPKPTLADVSGDGRADIVGFDRWGVSLARNLGGGAFESPVSALAFFGLGSGTGLVSWDESRPRLLADLTGNGAADIVGFSDDGTWVAVFDSDGPFAQQLVVHDFGPGQGWWPGSHPRFATDLTGDGRADLVGFGDAGVYVSLNLGEGPPPPTG